MTDLGVSGLVEALNDQRLLEPEHFDEFHQTMLPLCQDVMVLARELAWRGWLTPYQVERLIANDAASLFRGSYVLLEPLGEGGMGRVFRARNWKLNRLVALKLIGGDMARQPAVVARFQREIRALGRINHPNIVQAIDADFEPDGMFYAMESFDGHDLRRHVDENGPLAVEEACALVMQAADALQHAHELGLVHRDIKPSNLLLTFPDRVVKLLDLGLTRCEVPINDSVFNDLTRIGAIIGTPDYMSPEQVKDSRGADARSDLYSLGCTFYFLLAGRGPFEHLDAIVDKLQAQCEQEPTPITQLRPDLPTDVVDVVQKLMMKRRQLRYRSAGEVADQLELILHRLAPAGGDTLADERCATLSDAPVFAGLAPHGDATVVFEDDEIPMVSDGSLKPAKSRSSRVKWRHLIAGLAGVAFSVAAVRVANPPVAVASKQIAPATPAEFRPRADDDAQGPKAGPMDDDENPADIEGQ
jgi:serine/threonine-protein kinase